MDEDSHHRNPPEPVVAVLRVFGLLAALGERKETSLSELSVRLAMPKATVYRFLQTMKELGFVRQEPESERYSLTMKLFELGPQAMQHLDLIELARASDADSVRPNLGEAIHLGVLVDSEVIYIDKVDAKYSLGMYSRVGRRAPIHATALGKALLAWETTEAARRHHGWDVFYPVSREQHCHPDTVPGGTRAHPPAQVRPGL